MKFDKRPRYLAHLAVIVGILFVAYPIGNFFLTFQGDNGLIKMFIWFYIVLFLADNYAEKWLKV